MPPHKTLRVVQLLPELNSGGVERGTLEVAQALVEQGHRSIVISGGGRLVSQLLSTGSEHIQLPVGKKSLRSLKLIYALKKYFQQEAIDIIHARSRLPAWLAYIAWKSMAKNRPRFITTVHGAYSVNAYSKIMLRGQDIIAISEFIRRYISENYSDIAQEKITMIHRGVLKTAFPYGYKPKTQWLETWQQKHPKLTKKFILTLPARITRRKGHEDFLKILSQLKKHIPIHGLIVGGTDANKKNYLAELKQKAQQLNIADHIDFLDHRDDLKEIMAISNIVLSLSNKPEAFGRTILESLCLGVPTVAYAHGGNAEVLNAIYPHGCVKLNDIAAVCDKIMAIHKNPIAVPDKNPFTLEKMLQQTLALYEQKTA